MMRKWIQVEIEEEARAVGKILEGLEAISSCVEVSPEWEVVDEGDAGYDPEAPNPKS